MKASQDCIDLIKRFEKLRLKKYKCAAGVWTIGWGHVIKKDEDYETIDRATADSLFYEDLRIAEDCVCSLVKVPLTQYEFDALVSFVFNVGCNNFTQSTLLRKINRL